MERKPDITQLPSSVWFAGNMRRMVSSEAGQCRNVLSSADGIDSSQEAGMQAIAIVVAMLAAILVVICLPLFLSGKLWKAAEERAHARRLADARMNARLLRLNL